MRQTLDLVLMSFQLSDMSSKELAKELLAIKPATVIIVVVETTEVAEHGGRYIDVCGILRCEAICY